MKPQRMSNIQEDIRVLESRCKQYCWKIEKLEEKVEVYEERIQKLLERIVKDHPELDLYLCCIMSELRKEYDDDPDSI